MKHYPKLHDICAHTYKRGCPECRRLVSDSRLAALLERENREHGGSATVDDWPMCWEMDAETRQIARSVCP